MNASVSVARQGSGRRAISVGAAIVLTGGASMAALLAVTSIAAGGLVAAASHRPGALADWGRPVVAARSSPAPAPRAASIFAEHDAFFGRSSARLGDALAALGDQIVDARSLPEEDASTVRVAALHSKAPAPAVSPIASVIKIASVRRVVEPQPPVQASVIPQAPIRLASLEQPAPVATPAIVAPQADVVAAEPIFTPVARPRPLDLPRAVVRTAEPAVTAAPVPSAAPARRPTALAYAAPELETKSDGPNDFFRGLLGKGPDIPLPGARRGIAIYDIASATVRLPNGEVLEAHSGLGHRQDNAAYVREKNRGPTPPNVYSLRMREALFHGTEAIRLTPRDQKRVFNRDGLLAHPYMYVGGGSRSQSNGCVVFKNYGRFLRAFKAGEIAKLVVVPNMAALPTYMAGL